MPLTKKESAVLELLRSRRGECVSRHEIATVVFGRDFTESNVADVHVKNIRRKIGKTAIVTVRGKGYRAHVSKCCNAGMVNGGIQCESCGSNGE